MVLAAEDSWEHSSCMALAEEVGHILAAAAVGHNKVAAVAAAARSSLAGP